MTKKLAGRIVINPEIMRGKPVVKGTRLTVDLILRQLAQGITINDLLKNYPQITLPDVLACLEYAADTVEEENVYWRE